MTQLTTVLVRWDPNRENSVFFDQSAFLYCYYYLVQILVHRRFIPTYGKRTHSLPSQVVCTTAARACCRLLDIHQRRTGRPLPYQIVRNITASIKRSPANRGAPCSVCRNYRCRHSFTRHMAKQASSYELQSIEGDGGCTKMYGCAPKMRKIVSCLA